MQCPKCKTVNTTINTQCFGLHKTDKSRIQEWCINCGYTIVYDDELFELFLEIYSQELFNKPYSELTEEEKTPEYFINTIIFVELLFKV